jgi:dTDP-glucose 4,6-dehydratase
VVNFAAETHVDRSIHGPAAFVDTNIVATFALIDEVKAWWLAQPAAERAAFRFLHVSTDEVYGSLESADPAFSETTAYSPNSPYSASKAASDHLVRAYHHTFGLPTLTTHCSNNYGPLQFPEKLVPLMIVNALAGKPLPVYGDGLNVRDWLYVGDHCSAIRAVLSGGSPGRVYNVGGDVEMTNIDMVRAICRIVGELRPGPDYAKLVTFVRDRPGHDRRYAIDSARIRGELGWRPVESFESGMRRTIRWYLDNAAWLAGVTSGEYRHWVERHYVAPAGA